MPTSKSSGSFRRNRKGFTLIEIVVVMGVVAVLSSLMLGYSQRNSKQVLLATSQAKLASIFARAKFLSIQSFFYSGPRNEIICGHGVGIDTDTKKIFIFQDIIDEGPCSKDLDDYELDAGDKILGGELNQLNLADKGVNITTDSEYVIFIPPEPVVKFSGSTEESSVFISDADNENFKLGVTVTKDGQIRMD
ncbi:MAG: hypothetical protein UX31_C0019G0013 [Candidatus Nomurabacteria bacterium GW2011_GWA1_46_11]|uniref:General secretion pathway GspH domain-containing protein n=2 Tax=Parcubacteria group TaxID=1794811 RepID=A0A1G1YW84_9BACT|nr:MAG: hypothetical protein UX29_C0001G0069 [Parcubacteria group bacterium GW2011_GWA2_46_10]KKU21284.1 MAG: hypothetical protein UX31_C0019G0013 [Candidatus Nomurabacteria bacterium GW2011_GWA1_46_11]OGY56584.1 MAG: hypothetical protein A2119_01650 [Candidatus Colwellbacteria bacterium GWA2_46_10]